MQTKGELVCIAHPLFEIKGRIMELYPGKKTNNENQKMDR
jgi:hypothetical protein